MQLEEPISSRAAGGCGPRSDVSRTFLYQNADAKTLMITAISSAGDADSDRSVLQ